MITGIKPRVNEAREFLEIAKDFKDAKEIIREALSNSWDAGATNVTLNFDLQKNWGERGKKIVVNILDNGEGMSSMLRPGIGTSEIEDFFNLGDSHKAYGCIGSKGHGAKIYYKSSGITVTTFKNGKNLIAKTEVNPWESLSKGIVPTYCLEEADRDGKGTQIFVDGFLGKQKDFESADELIQYILWYTVIGSFGNYFGHPRKMDVALKTTNSPSPISISFGFVFPDENLDLSNTSDNFCKIFGPEKISCGETEAGEQVEVEIIGAVLGESKRSFVPHTYEMMGLWFCKDYIKIERDNTYVEDVFGGQYYYRSIVVFANCQKFDLTANRNNIRREDEEYGIAVEGIKSFIKIIKESDFTKKYFEMNKKEKEERENKRKKDEEKKRVENRLKEINRRINKYKGRTDLNSDLQGSPIKEPVNEAETALLLQSMISCTHPGIDFRIGEYNANFGTDLIVEYNSKGIPSFAWVELVHKLSNLFVWVHPPEGIHKIVCWELGECREKQNLIDGREAKLAKRTNGRYNLDISSDTIDVYALKRITLSKIIKMVNYDNCRKIKYLDSQN